MLQRIAIQNYALIESLEIELNQGLNVITGETGAGKSIIIDAITLLLGQRGNKENIRQGAKKMTVQGVFDVSKASIILELLDEMDIEVVSGELILSRSIDTRGKNVCRANGYLITVAQLKSIGERLVDIHSQHEHNSLFKAESHRDLVDAYGGEAAQALLAQTAESTAMLRALNTQIRNSEKNIKEVLRQQEMLTYELNTIKKARLVPGEDEALEQEKRILQNSEVLFSNATAAYHTISGEDELESSGVLAKMDQLNEYTKRLATIDPSFIAYGRIIEGAYNELENISGELYAYIDAMDFDMGTLDEVEKRLSELTTLKRKFGKNIDELIEYADQIETKLDSISEGDGDSQRLKAQYMAIWSEYKAVSAKLYALRQTSAQALKVELESELHDLAMEKAEIQVDIEQDDRLISKHGQNRVEFLISVNPGIPPRPIRKIASGGEISRIMLALKCIFGELDTIGTMIFDEIDTGISGRTAQSVAEKILGLSRHRQLICITHLPQIAAMADKHFRVVKDTDTDAVEVHFETLSPDDQRDELARMLSGATMTQTTYDHAQEMLEMTKKLKKTWNK